MNCPCCQSQFLFSEDRGPHCDGCEDYENSLAASDGSVVSIPVEEYESLKQDKARLDFLEHAHKALNSRCGTNYGWKLIINHNVIRAMVKNCHPWDGKDGIDLHDSQGGLARCKTCRNAIDEVISQNEASLESRYDWLDCNRRKFNTWAEEISYAESLGYILVPPEYYLPHWSTAMSMGSELPKIYVMRNDGPDELRTHMDCNAARLGYPVYYKPNDQSEARPREQPEERDNE